jgi:pyruvyltransferase
MAVETISGVDVVHWNPRANHLPFPFRRVRYGRRTNNFGDLLGPLIVARILNQLEAPLLRTARSARGRLLTVGSILPMAQSGDTIWGSGMNGKHSPGELHFGSLEVCSVRGPITAEILVDRGIDVPAIYGDPGLLIPTLFPELSTSATSAEIGIVPNFHEMDRFIGEGTLVSPIGDPLDKIKEICGFESIVSSSLHGIVIAEAFGIPAVLIRPERETLLKYRDYYLGTSREEFPVAENAQEAFAMLKSGEQAKAPLFDSESMIEAFPRVLWTGE